MKLRMRGEEFETRTESGCDDRWIEQPVRPGDELLIELTVARDRPVYRGVLRVTEDGTPTLRLIRTDLTIDTTVADDVTTDGPVQPLFDVVMLPPSIREMATGRPIDEHGNLTGPSTKSPTMAVPLDDQQFDLALRAAEPRGPQIQPLPSDRPSKEAWPAIERFARAAGWIDEHGNLTASAEQFVDGNGDMAMNRPVQPFPSFVGTPVATFEEVRESVLRGHEVPVVRMPPWTTPPETMPVDPRIRVTARVPDVRAVERVCRDCGMEVLLVVGDTLAGKISESGLQRLCRHGYILTVERLP